MKVYCEYLKDPVGIDALSPRFTWIGEEKTMGAQRAYRIKVYDDKRMNAGSCVWDSGTVLSAASVNIPYGGERLRSAGSYYYTVTVTYDNGKSFTSPVSSFVTGLLEKDEWRADWLGGPWMEVNAFWFRTSVNIRKAVKEAYIYVLSGNYYILSVNGEKADDSVLQSANTDPDKTVLYAAYPVGDRLVKGENVIGVELGNGWKALLLGVNSVGLGEHSFSLQMYVRYKDGTDEWIYSRAADWIYAREGPMGENSIYQGETYDARKEMTGWDAPGFDFEGSGVEWLPAVEFEPETGQVRAQALEPIRVVREIEPIDIYDIGDGSYTFDMGQNFAGWARLKIKAKAGTEIKLVYSELIFDDRRVNQVSLRHMRCTDTYICRGGAAEVYEPSFTFHGFRYVQVFGLPKKPDKKTLTGCLVRSDVERIGSFSCSSELLNKLHENICWTEESNLHSIPTDCPQRNERLGWINDMSVRNECALYSYRMAALYTKWLQDIVDTQGEKTGAISDTAPFRVYGCRPADPVGISLFLVPWNMYRHYSDRRVLERFYGPMKKLFAYWLRNADNYVLPWATMGDWAAPIGDNDLDSIGGGAVSLVTPPRMMATASFHYCALLMEKIAAVLQKDEDVSFYRGQAGHIRKAFLEKYYDSKKKTVCTGSQGSLTAALYYGLIPQEDIPAVMKNLVHDIVDVNKMHLTTGNMCSRYIVEVLFKYGYPDIAYALLTQRSYPSWGYMIDHGATTIWERWEEITGENTTQSIMCSYSHPMYGAVGVTFYKYLAGIDTSDEKPGFENIIIKPVIPEDLKEASAYTDTLRGRVKNSWKQEKDAFCMETLVPYNSSARIHVPLGGRKAKDISLSVNDELLFDAGRSTDGSFKVWEEDGYLILDAGPGLYRSVVKQSTKHKG